MTLRRRTTLLVLAVLVVLVVGVVTATLGLRDTDGSDDSSDPADTGRDAGQTQTPTTQTPTTPGSSSADEPSTSPASGVRRYVALGDSYTAAPGVPQTDLGDVCLRSTGSYPYLVEQALAPGSFADPSCSGADTSDLTGSQETARGSLDPQVDAVTADTDLVTIGIGGNDFDIFSTMVGTCTDARSLDPTGSPCREQNADGDGDAVLNRLASVSQRIETVVAAVRERAPGARVLLVGYPQIVPASGTCEDRMPLADGDYAYVREVNKGLDTAVRRAAAATDATFVDVWSASSGHDVCASTPWVNGQASDTGRAAPYHPFDIEQQAVARLVVDAVGAGS